MSMNEIDKLLKVKDVLELIPVSKPTWYEIIKSDKKLKPIKIGRGSFWKQSTISMYIDELDS